MVVDVYVAKAAIRPKSASKCKAELRERAVESIGNVSFGGFVCVCVW